MYQEANKNYDLLFSVPEDEPRKITKQINIMMGEYPDWDELKKKITEKYGDETFDRSYLFELIDRLNSIENTFDISVILNEMANIPNVKEVLNSLTGEYKVVTEQGIVYFSDIFTFIEKLNNGDKSDDMKDYLKRASSLESRLHHCHAEAINLAILLDRDYKIPCKVVTGYTSVFTSKNKYIHTWNELNIDGKEYVVDTTMNTFLNKEGYYYLKNVNEKENLSSIDSDIIVEDFGDHIDFIDQIDLKSYLTCRDEIMSEYKNKMKLFNKTNEGDER